MDKEEIAFIIFYVENLWDDDLDYSEEQLNYYYEKWQRDFVPEKDGKHWGDCVRVPMTCMRCLMDEFYSHAESLIEFLKAKNGRNPEMSEQPKRPVKVTFSVDGAND